MCFGNRHLWRLGRNACMERLMNKFQKDIDLLFKLNSADIEALEDARFTLDAIKEAESGVYDEMIDESLRLIHKALNISCADSIERIAKRLGVQV